MIKIRPVEASNVVEVELSNGTVFRIVEFFTGKLTIYIPASPGSVSSVHSPLHFHRVEDIEEVEVSPR